MAKPETGEWKEPDDPARPQIVDPSIQFQCAYAACQRWAVNTGDFPFCSYVCKCEDRKAFFAAKALKDTA